MTLFTVGPVQMYKETLELKALQLPYFRTNEFSKLIEEIDRSLVELLNAPEGAKTILLTASGTGAMEAGVINCFNQEDKLLIISGGSFGKRFCEICEVYHIPYEEVQLKFGETLTLEHLEPFYNQGFTGLLVNVHETSTGQLYDLKMLSQFCKANDMYLMVDAISSFLADRLDMKALGIDAIIMSSQKALALSPGISMVVLSEKIIKERVECIKVPSLYFDFKDYLKNMERYQTPYTPAVGILIEMKEMLESISKQGIENKIKHIADLAMYFRNGVRQLGIKLPDYPLSNALTPIIFEGNAESVYQILKNEYGLVVTPSGGNLKHTLLRVGHLGNLDYTDYDKLLDVLKKII